jgi:hypothetical protein
MSLPSGWPLVELAAITEHASAGCLSSRRGCGDGADVLGAFVIPRAAAATCMALKDRYPGSLQAAFASHYNFAIPLSQDGLPAAFAIIGAMIGACCCRGARHGWPRRDLSAPGRWRSGGKRPASAAPTMWITAEEMRQIHDEIWPILERYPERVEDPSRRPPDARAARVFFTGVSPRR